jgi:hypothetical protein
MVFMSFACGLWFLRIMALKNCCSEGYTQLPVAALPSTGTAGLSVLWLYVLPAPRGIVEISRSVARGTLGEEEEDPEPEPEPEPEVEVWNGFSLADIHTLRAEWSTGQASVPSGIGGWSAGRAACAGAGAGAEGAGTAGAAGTEEVSAGAVSEPKKRMLSVVLQCQIERNNNKSKPSNYSQASEMLAEGHTLP